MSRPTNILPHKHVPFSDSVLAFAGWLRRHLDQPRSVDELWAIANREDSDWPTRPSFTTVVLAINTLYALGQITEVNESGRVELQRT